MSKGDTAKRRPELGLCYQSVRTKHRFEVRAIASVWSVVCDLETEELYVIENIELLNTRKFKKLLEKKEKPKKGVPKPW